MLKYGISVTKSARLKIESEVIDKTNTKKVEIGPGI